MMLKRSYLLLVLSLFTGLNLSAQNFYETSWESGGVDYDAFLVFHSDNDAFMRVKYTVSEVYRVAEFDITGEYLQLEDGSTCYLLSGEDARIVYGSADRGYSADNFIFYQESDGTYGNPFVIDNEGLESDDVEAAMQQVESWSEIDPASTFTEQYVFNFFDKDEAMYNTLLALNPSNAATVSGVGDDAEGLWRVVMSKGTGYTRQTWKTSYEWPREWIKEKWDDTYHITDLMNGNGVWMVTMAKGSGMGLQSWKTSADWPKDWIREKWDNSQYINSIGYGEGKWAIVMSKGTSTTRQTWKTSAEWPREWIKEKWAEDYYITESTYGGGVWAVVMSKGSSMTRQSWKLFDTFPEDWVETKWGEGYDITNIAFGGGKWSVVMSQGVNLVQSYDEGDTWPKEYVKTKWDADYYISSVAYGGYEEAEPIYAFDNPTNSTPSNAAPSTTTTTTTAAPNVHLIVVANTRVSDIGVSCRIDRDQTVQEFQDMTQELGIDLHKHIIDGENMTKARVQSTLNNLNPGPNDVVVFIYTGHGFRWSDQTSSYPTMALWWSRFDAPSRSNSMALEDVYKSITAKGARLNIVMGDCCNSDIGITSRGGSVSLASRNNTRGRIERLRELLFSARGNLLIAAAKPNETSCGSSAFGGYFLSSFWSSLAKETSVFETGSTSWESVTKRAIENATYKTQNLNGCTTQHGIYHSTIND